MPRLPRHNASAKPALTAESALPALQTTGATPQTPQNPATVKETVAKAPVAARKVKTEGSKTGSSMEATGAKRPHQTHGAFTPINGPITSVNQLTRGGKSVAQGSIASHETLAQYTSFLLTLSQSELHLHAVEEAHIVPIDDRDRLIKRLEQEWTAMAGRTTAHHETVKGVQRPNFTAEQFAEQDAIRRKMLRR